MVFAIALVAVWALYGMLRVRSDAMTPANAPPFYTFAGPSLSPHTNLLEYADRSLTFPVAVTLLTHMMLTAAHDSLDAAEETAS